MKKEILLFCLLSILFQQVIFSQGYKIDVAFKGMEGKEIILGYHFNELLKPADTVVLNKKGIGSFKGDEPLKGGMYLLLAPEIGYVDILVDRDQEFKLFLDTTDLVGNAKAEGTIDNEVFFDFQRFMIEKQRASKGLFDARNTAEGKEKEEIEAKINALNNEVEEYRENVINTYAENFVGQFINATTDIDVPDAPRDEKGNITDSTFQYRYYKAHYFDNMDAGDARMLRTPLFEKHLMRYIDKVIPQHPDSLIKEVDMLIEKSRSDDELFRYMLITLFNHFAQSKLMGIDAVYIHIAEKYYIPEATWSSEEFINDLKKTVKERKPLLIGKIGPDAELFMVPSEHFKQAANDTALMRNPHIGMFVNIHQFNSPYLLLAFWEADCGHCKKAIPKLYELYVDTLKNAGVEILSVSKLGGIEGKEKWIKFVNKHELYDWVNCWNPYSYDYSVKYHVETTPTLYLLDKDKKIIAKQIGPEQVLDIVNLDKKIRKL